MTIKQAQLAHFGKPGRALEKRIKNLPAPLNTQYRAGSEYTDELADALGLPRPSVLLSSPNVPDPSPPVREEVEPDPVPDVRKMIEEVKESFQAELRDQVPDPPEEEVPDPPQKVRVRDQVFQNDIALMVALLVIALADGESFRVLAVRYISDTITTNIFFFFGGLAIAYGAMKNAYDLHRKPVKVYLNNNALTNWIVIFAIYQGLLHGTAAEFFGSINMYIGKFMLMIGLPLTAAGLLWASFQKDK